MKKFRKVLAILLALGMILGLAACGGNSETKEPADGEKLKVGFIYLHDENSTYDNNFIKAAKAACEALDVEYIAKVNIPEGAECKEAALDLADNGCDIIQTDWVQMTGQYLESTGKRNHR